ncbi:MAG TPA: gamma carbonic anhydrase family protein [Terriglobales bacterium]|nr:gamma carbonic anhydrase family protein [Terriglobales bacterium]
MLVAYRNHLPILNDDVFIEDTARIIGDVEIGEGSSVWFYAVVRGDIQPIRIGARTNLQDHVVVHVTRERYDCSIGDDVTVGHRATLHGCRIGNRCLIGIGAIVLDGADIGDDCMVAAGALVTPRTVIASGSVVMGQPGKIVRQIRPEEIEHIRQSGAAYCEYARFYRGVA